VIQWGTRYSRRTSGGMPLTLELTLLGGFQAWIGSGGFVSVPSRKAQALLAYLAVRPGCAQPRDKLAALLWADQSEGRARDGLRHAIAALRRALPPTSPPVLMSEGQTLAVCPAAVTVDIGQFERQMAEGTPESLERAAELYRGDCSRVSR
jgi:DNA-binding SARP family transcriptional activator